ncbi:hypothetical protein MMPV_003115 [Pyropia vietnamensis]
MRSRPGSGLPPAGRPSNASSRLAPAVTASSVRRHHRWRIRWRKRGGGHHVGGSAADAATAAAAASLVGPAPGSAKRAGKVAAAAKVPAITATPANAPATTASVAGAQASSGGGLAPSASIPAVGGAAAAEVLSGSSSAAHVDTDLFGRGDERVFAPLSELAAAGGHWRGGGGGGAAMGGAGGSRGVASGRSSLRNSVFGRSWTARRSPSSSGGLRGGGGSGRVGRRGGTAGDAQVLSIARALAERDAKLAAFGAAGGGEPGASPDAAAAASGLAAGPDPGITRLRVEGVVAPGSTVPAPRLVADSDPTAGGEGVGEERAPLPVRPATVAVMRGARGRGAGTRLPAALFPPAGAAGVAGKPGAVPGVVVGGVTPAPHARGVRQPVCNDGRDYTARGRAEQAVAAVAAARAAALVAAAPTVPAVRPTVAASAVPAVMPPAGEPAAVTNGDRGRGEGKSAISESPFAVPSPAVPAVKPTAAPEGQALAPQRLDAAPIPLGKPAATASRESIAATSVDGATATAVAAATPSSSVSSGVMSSALTASAPEGLLVAPLASGASALPVAAPPTREAASTVPVAAPAAEEPAVAAPVTASAAPQAAPTVPVTAPAVQGTAAAAHLPLLTTPSVAPFTTNGLSTPAAVPAPPVAVAPSLTLPATSAPSDTALTLPSSPHAPLTLGGDIETKTSLPLVVAAGSTPNDYPDAQEDLHDETETCSSASSSCHDWTCNRAPTAAQKTPPVSRPAPVQGDEFLRKLALASSSTTASPEGAISPHGERFCPPLEATLNIPDVPVASEVAASGTEAAVVQTTAAVTPLPVEEALRFVDAEDDDTGSAGSAPTPQTPVVGTSSSTAGVVSSSPAVARTCQPRLPAAHQTRVYPPAMPTVPGGSPATVVDRRPRSPAPTSGRDGGTAISLPRRDAVSNVVRSIEAAIQRNTAAVPSLKKLSVIPAAVARQKAAVVYGLPPAPELTSLLELPDLCLPDAGGAGEMVGTPLTPHAFAAESVPAARSSDTAAVLPAARHVGQASLASTTAATTVQSPAPAAAATSPGPASRVRAMVAALDMRAAGLSTTPSSPLPPAPPVVVNASSARRSSPGRDVTQSQVIRLQRLVITPPTTPRSASATTASPTALRMQRQLPFMGKSSPRAPPAATAPPLTLPATTASPKTLYAAATERDSVIKVALAAEAAEAAAQAAVVAAEAVTSAVEAAAAQAEQRASKSKRRMQRVNAQSSRPAGSGYASRSPNRRVRRQARPGARQLLASESEGVASWREGNERSGPPSRGAQLRRPEANMYVGGSDADDDDADAADEALWPDALLALRDNPTSGSLMPSVSSQDRQDSLSTAMSAMLD